MIIEKLLRMQYNDTKRKYKEAKAEYNRLLKEEGPDHDKSFLVQACINGSAVSKGVGRTKKAAEQQAAYEAIKVLRKQEDKK